MHKVIIPFLLLFLVISSFAVPEATKENPISIEPFFCPHDDCETVLIQVLQQAKDSIHCAFFELNLPQIQNILQQKAKTIDVKIIVDEQYLHKFNQPFVRHDAFGLMHNKFCIIDQTTTISGSMNPTKNGATKNNNNLLLIYSPKIAQTYEQEFAELWQGQFKGGLQQPFSAKNISVYFCPEDQCAYRIKEMLKQANESIYFMTFSFTSSEIANILLLKHLENMTIKGIMEARQISDYSQFQRLQINGIEVLKDANKNMMHHKVFLVDERCVITGSMNPTDGGNRRNDENVLIICDPVVAGKFYEEFTVVYAAARKSS